MPRTSVRQQPPTLLLDQPLLSLLDKNVLFCFASLASFLSAQARGHMEKHTTSNMLVKV